MTSWLNDFFAKCSESPIVWVERIALFESIELPPFRQVELARGLNIIWASEQSGQQEHLGHGVGKTSFCRLLRYCLGEKTFAPRALRRRVIEAYPRGYVAAEVWVGELKWVIARPFDSQFKRFAQNSGAIDGIFQADGKNAWDEYLESIDKTVFPFSKAPTLPSSGQDFTWLHLLSWCARDQEAHLDNFSLWRAPRSESDSPAFKRPTQDPVEAVRFCLGLMDTDELTLEGQRKSLVEKTVRLSQQVSSLEQKPGLMRDALVERLGNIIKLPTELPVSRQDPGLFPDDILGALQERISSIEDKVVERDGERQELEQEKFALELRKSELQDVLGRLENKASYHSGRKVELDKRQERRRHIWGLISKPGDNFCEYGDVLFAQCEHIATRRNALDMDIRRKGRESDGEYQGRMQAIQKVNQQCDDYRSAITACEEEVLIIEEEHRNVLVRLRTDQVSLASLLALQEQLEYYDGVLNGRVPAVELDQARGGLIQAQESLKKVMDKISLIRLQQTGKADDLTALFSGLGETIIPESNGRAVLSDQARPFQLLGRGGEAFHAMEVILGDITSALYSSAYEGHHPGLLIHDSPREADMGDGLYSRYNALLLQLGEAMRGRCRYPLQYIVATTTAPSRDLIEKKYVKLQLNAASDDGFLFKQSFPSTSESELGL
jgi:hypothetical protein